MGWQNAPVVGGGGWQSAPIVGGAPPSGPGNRLIHEGEFPSDAPQSVRGYEQTDFFPGADAGPIPYGTAPRARAAQIPGVDFGSAPTWARFKAGFGDHDEGTYQAALGPDYETRKLGPEGGEWEGRILFRKRGTGENWRTVSDPRTPIDLQDLAGSVGELLPMLGGAGGGFAGAFGGGGVGSVATAAGGTGLGALAGEVGRKLIGQRLGVVDDTKEVIDLMAESSGRAALDALGAGGTTAAYGIYKAFARRGMPQLSLEEFSKAWEAAKAKVSGAGMDPNLLTPAAVMKGTPEGSELAALQARVASRPVAGRALEQRERDVAEAGVEATSPTLRTSLTPEQLGGRAQTAVETDQAERAAPHLARDVTATGEAQDAQQRAFGGAQNPKTAGEPVGDALTAAEKAADAAADAAFNPIRARARGMAPVEPANTAAFARDNLAALERDLLPSLAEEDARLLGGFLDTKAGAPADYDQLSRALSAVRRAIRNSYKGEGPGASGDVTMLRGLEKALEEDRMVLLGGKDAPLAKQLLSAEETYRQQRDLFQRSYVGDILSLKRGGREAVPDESVAARILRSPSSASAIAEALPKDATGDAAREAIRASMRWEAARAAGVLGGGRLNPEALKAWIATNKPTLSKFFSAGEINALGAPASATITANRWREIADQTMKALGPELKSLGIDASNPQAFFRTVYDGNNPQVTRRVLGILDARDPQAGKAFRAMAQAQFQQDLMRVGPDGIRRVDPAKMTPEKLDQMADILGPQFKVRMRAIAEALETLTPAGVSKTEIEPAKGFVGNIKAIARPFVPVLSREGRILTTAMKYTSESVNQRIAEALTDPAAFQALLKKGLNKAGTRRSAAAIAAALTDATQD